MDTNSTLTPLIKSLLAGTGIALPDWPLEVGDPSGWGLAVDGGHVRMSVPPDPLDAASIRGGLGASTRQWLQLLEVHPVLGSTNSRVLDLAAQGAAAGAVCLAELQTAGRGRRGRSWVTPLGGSLALSVGFSLQRPLSELGGLSLAVGLALLDTLQSLGAAGLSLKWPNDLLHEHGKLAGVLIELKGARRHGGTDVVVGIGLNVHLPGQIHDSIDQHIADLRGAGIEVRRNDLVARLLDSLLVYINAFDAAGFAPMREQYDQHHLLHGRECEIYRGDRVQAGRVQGVTKAGELRVATSAGSELLRAGEVSLRALG